MVATEFPAVRNRDQRPGFGEQAFTVMMRTDHHSAAGCPNLAELVRENWIVAPQGMPTRHSFEKHLLSQRLVLPARACAIVRLPRAERRLLRSGAVGPPLHPSRKRIGPHDGLKLLPIRLLCSLREIGPTVRRHQRLTVAQQTFVKLLPAAWRAGRGK